MNKLPGWQERLDALIDSRRDEPFKWGSNDCCQFAAQALNAMVDGSFHLPDVAVRFYEGYSTKRGAVEILRDITGKLDYSEAMRSLPSVVGLKKIEVNFAQRGDMVLIPMSRRRAPALGIVSLDGRYAVAPGPDGLKRVAVRECIAAWRV